MCEAWTAWRTRARKDSVLAVGRVSEQRLNALSWKLVRCRLPLGKEMLQVALLLAQITLVWPRLSAPLIGDGTVTTLPTVTPEVS